MKFFCRKGKQALSCAAATAAVSAARTEKPAQKRRKSDRMQTHTRFIAISLPYRYEDLSEKRKAEQFVFSFSQSTSPAKPCASLGRKFHPRKPVTSSSSVFKIGMASSKMTILAANSTFDAIAASPQSLQISAVVCARIPIPSDFKITEE